MLLSSDPDIEPLPEESKISNTTTTAAVGGLTAGGLLGTCPPSSIHPWVMMREQMFQSCLKSNPTVSADGIHKHSDDCFKHLQPINPSSISATTNVTSNGVSSSTTFTNPDNCSKLGAEKCSKLSAMTAACNKHSNNKLVSRPTANLAMTVNLKS